MQTFIASLLVLLLVLLTVTQPGQPIGVPRSCTIKAQPVESISEAAILTRKLMPNSFEEKERCMRYGVLLNMGQANWNQFSIAENSFAASSKISRIYHKLDFAKLRNSLMKAIEDFESRNVTDKAWIELIECLRSGFGRTDAKARKFLQEQTRLLSMRQYDSIVSMPYSWLFNRDQPHPELTGDQLTDQMKLFALGLLDNNEQQFNLMFPSAGATATASETHSATDSPLETGTGAQLEAPGETTAESEVPAAAAQVADDARGQAGAVKPQQHASLGQQHRELAPPRQQQQAGTMASVHADQPYDGAHGQAEEEEVRLDEDILIGLAAGSHLLFDKFKDDTHLSDRCNHYGKLFSTPKQQLSLDYIEELAEEGHYIVSSINAEGTHSALEDKSVRAQFMQVINAFDSEEVGDFVWVELMDCLYEWQDQDNEVKIFLNDPVRSRVYSNLLHYFSQLKQATPPPAVEIMMTTPQLEQQAETQIEAPPSLTSEEQTATATTPMADQNPPVSGHNDPINNGVRTDYRETQNDNDVGPAVYPAEEEKEISPEERFTSNVGNLIKRFENRDRQPYERPAVKHDRQIRNKREAKLKLSTLHPYGTRSFKKY